MTIPVTTDQNFPNVVLSIFQKDGVTPAKVNGVPVWASSDPTIITVKPNPDGMGGVVNTVAPGTARVTVSADADIGGGPVIPITGVSDDIVVTAGTGGNAAVMTLSMGAPVAKPAPAPAPAAAPKA
jgi:hypothetical protein